MMLKFNKIKDKMIPTGAEGFTIPELLIATAVFSVVLMATMVIFFMIGNIFFKGVTLTNTQQSAKKIQDSLSADITIAPSGFAPNPVTTGHGDGAGHTASYICINGVRYTYYLDKEVNGDPDQLNNFALIRDYPTSAAPPGNVCNNPFGGTPFTKADQMLGNKMRMTDLSVVEVGSFGLWDTSVTLAYGDNEVLNNPSQANYPTCLQGLKFSQFCSVTSLSTTVSQGI